MAVKTKDTGFRNYYDALKALGSAKVAVGLFADVGDEVITKGVVNEFGSGNIPERSFLRSTYNENYKDVAKDFVKIHNAILRKAKLLDRSSGNHKVLSKLKLIGLKQEAAIRRKIVTLRTPPNAESTIIKKKSSNPLIDTGELRISVSSELRNV